MRILFFQEEEQNDAHLLRQFLAYHRDTIQSDEVSSESELLRIIYDEKSASGFDAVLLDYGLQHASSLELIRDACLEGRSTLPIVLAATEEMEEIGLEALKLGAFDYVIKNPAQLQRLPHILRVAADVSKLTRENRVLQEKQNRYRLLLNHGQDVVFIYRTATQQFAYINPAIFNLIGYTPEEIYATPDLLWAMIRADENIFSENMAIQTGDFPKTITSTMPWLHRNGQEKWIKQQLILLGAPDSENLEVYGIAHDVTSYRQKEAENVRNSAEKDDAIRRLSESYEKTIEGWALALELRDRDSQGHSMRVADLTVRTAVALGISGETLDHIRRGALLHDIGKMSVPDAILQKPGPLTETEWFVMRVHPAYGYQILDPVEFLRPAIDIPYYHRERWDGSGYPHGLKGEEIPLPARIFAVVDVWEALNSDRPYRPAWNPNQVAHFLQEQAGVKFDPHVVEVFLREVVADQL